MRTGGRQRYSGTCARSVSWCPGPLPSQTERSEPINSPDHGVPAALDVVGPRRKKPVRRGAASYRIIRTLPTPCQTRQNAGVDPGKQRPPPFKRPKVIITSMIVLPLLIGLTAFFAARAWTREGTDDAEIRVDAYPRPHPARPRGRHSDRRRRRALAFFLRRIPPGIS